MSETEATGKRHAISYRDVDPTAEERPLADKDLEFLRNAFASSHINFLLGSGFCGGVLPTLGEREKWLTEVSAGENSVESAILHYEFFRSVIAPMADAQPTSNMVEFARQIKRLLETRGTTAIPKKANLFTTNYDALIEDALEKAGVSYNDGFTGRGNPVFGTKAFARLHYSQSLSMEYTSQIPTLNVIKLHGSVTWDKDSESESIRFRRCSEALQDLIERHPDVIADDTLTKIQRITASAPDEKGLEKMRSIAASLESDRDEVLTFHKDYRTALHLINPTKHKFEETVMGLAYYELLRLFANELDRNNALLIAFGFSFADEHILEITKRALDNPRLILLICCHKPDAEEWYRNLFGEYGNVWYIVPETELNLKDLCRLLSEVQ